MVSCQSPVDRRVRRLAEDGEKMVRFEYLEPTTLVDAAKILTEHAGKCEILAGGTDLLVELKNREKRPEYVVNIKRIAGLDSIDCSKDGLVFGSLATARQLEHDPNVRELYPMVAETAGIIGSDQVRTTATIAGNICTALPSAEMGPPLLVLDANITIAGMGGVRTVPVTQFFTGPRQTVVGDGDIVTAIGIAAVPENTGMVYVRHSPRQAMDLAVVGVAAYLTIEDDTVKDVRIALGAVAPTPIRATDAEKSLLGRPASLENIQEAADLAAAAAKPISDMRASADYRRDMVGVLTRRMLLEAKRRAGLKPGSFPLLKYHISSDFPDA